MSDIKIEAPPCIKCGGNVYSKVPQPFVRKCISCGCIYDNATWKKLWKNQIKKLNEATQR